jgi:hypothetical protein
MAITQTREVVIEASPREILDVMADIESLADWSSAHQSPEVLETGDDGLPSKAKMIIKTAGVADVQVLAYTWGDNTLSWTLVSSGTLRAQDALYTLTPEAERTRVKFNLTLDALAPVPGFILKRVAKGFMETATEGLRKRVLKVKRGK